MSVAAESRLTAVVDGNFSAAKPSPERPRTRRSLKWRRSCLTTAATTFDECQGANQLSTEPESVPMSLRARGALSY